MDNDVIAKYLLEGRSCDFCSKSLDCKLYGKINTGVCDEHVWALEGHFHRKTLNTWRKARESIMKNTRRR